MDRPAGLGGERNLLRQIRLLAGSTARTGVRLGIGDDCALLGLRPGEEAAITTDLSIAGRHFLLDKHPPESVGHRTLARGLSDLAAMGARPVAAFLSLGVPAELTTAKRGRRSWVDGFLQGLLALAEAEKVPLAGGDLAQSPVAVADIVLVGAVPSGKALLRSGARPGDLLYVTGRIGGSGAGLSRVIEHTSAKITRPGKGLAALLAPHLYPQPRVAQGLYLRRRRLATAALDISDGLSTDLAHLCEESGVSADVRFDLLPIAETATVDQALHGGEDYELLFTGRPGARIPRCIAGVPVTQIGTIRKTTRDRARVSLISGRTVVALAAKGWEHFA